MRVFTYFIEPASYTLDLISNVHNLLGFNIAFIRRRTEVKDSSQQTKGFFFLSDKSIFSKMWYIYSVWVKNDLIIINGYNNYVFLSTFLLNILSFNKRYLAIESDTQLRIPKNFFKRVIKSCYLKIIFNNKFILGFAGGSNNHKELFRFYGMNEERIYLMPMMVNNDKYYHNKIFPDIFTLLYVGRLFKTKNVDVLCRTFLDNFSDKDARLIIVGDGEDFERLQYQFLHSKIDFKGKVFSDRLIDIYHESSVFVFPSTWEQWGMVVNEALSSSLPVIAHKNVGAVYDLISMKGTGFIIDSWDELAERMLELYNNRKTLLRFSKNSKELMKSYWNYNLYKKNIEKVIKAINK